MTPFPKVDGLRSAEIGTPGEMRARLNALILAGTKRATAGLLAEYVREGEPVEHVGELLALVDDELRRIATLRVTRVELSRFADVPDAFAIAEGEGPVTG
ncbi:MAG: ASCH domain-containing protein, partial [Actinomycetota bacterium]